MAAKRTTSASTTARSTTLTAAQQVSVEEAAAALILQREEERRRIARKRAAKRRRKQRDAERQAFLRMQRSVEVIKWCIVSICTVWVLSFVVGIYVLIQVDRKVKDIETEVTRIKHVMENPFASAGTRLGAQVDEKLKEFFRNSSSSDQ